MYIYFDLDSVSFYWLYFNFTGPKIYGPRLSPRMLHLSYRRVQRQILYLHNAFRSQVKPPASDMLAMVSFFNKYLF